MKRFRFTLKIVLSFMLLVLFSNLQAQIIEKFEVKDGEVKKLEGTENTEYDSVIVYSGGELIINHENDKFMTIHKCLLLKEGAKLTIGDQSPQSSWTIMPTPFIILKPEAAIETYTDSSNISGYLSMNMPGGSGGGTFYFKGDKPFKVGKIFFSFQGSIESEIPIYVKHELYSKAQWIPSKIETNGNTVILSPTMIFNNLEGAMDSCYIRISDSAAVIKEINTDLIGKEFKIRCGTEISTDAANFFTSIYFTLKSGTLGDNPAVKFILRGGPDEGVHPAVPDTIMSDASDIDTIIPQIRRYLHVELMDITNAEYDVHLKYLGYDVSHGITSHMDSVYNRFYDGTTWSKLEKVVWSRTDVSVYQLEAQGLTKSGALTAWGYYPVEIDHPQPSSISKIQTNTIFDCYPNPNTGQFKITFNKNLSGATISIYNALGKIIYKENNVNITPNAVKQINLNGLQQGVYFLKVSDGQNTAVNKIIIK